MFKTVRVQERARAKGNFRVTRCNHKEEKPHIYRCIYIYILTHTHIQIRVFVENIAVCVYIYIYV